MWREIDPRAPERERPEPGLGRVSGQTEMESKAVSDDPRDAFTRDLDLPRGSSRERVRANDWGDHAYWAAFFSSRLIASSK